MDNKKIEIFNTEIDLLFEQELIQEIMRLSAESKSIVGHVNIKGLNLAYEDDRFASFYDRCKLVYCDGFGPLLAAKILGQDVENEHRNTCPDFLDALLDRLKAEGKKIFFLGGTQDVIVRLDQLLEKKHAGLNYDLHHGFFNKQGDENDRVVELINTYCPDILYVGFGMPLQEYWIMDNFEAINTHVFLPEGACLDFYTNTTYRAPDFLTDNGMEWVTRLMTEPARLWKRYIVGNPLFFYRVLKSKI